MYIVEYFIKNRVASSLFTVILLVGGIFAFDGLGRLEDPEFTVKVAVVTTAYPGASPEQVEEEVTYPIENALQQLPYVDYIKSISSDGLSQITVNMKETYRKDALKQIWDEMRKKIADLTPDLPQGGNQPIVMDDFSDVYGILLTISGDGYDYEEIRDYLDVVRRELILVDGVSKVTVAGTQEGQVAIEISKTKLAAINVSQDRIFNLLQSQNQIFNSGGIKSDQEYIRIESSGQYQDLSDLENLLISDPNSNGIIYLKDIANVTRTFAEIPRNIISYQGQQALMLGISFSTGVNVVEVGARVKEKLEQLESARPVGLKISTVYSQPDEVKKSMSSFINSLIQAVAIVLVVLLIFMGVKSGLIIGLVLLVTVFGSFIFISQAGIQLHRISLGALIIALGMLVDNAIVVVEGILIGLKRGQTKLAAAMAITKQTALPLLGATVIAIAAFAPIGLSSDATGEFAGSLFWVLLISLALSWVTAMTLTPFLADVLLKETSERSEQHEELYKGKVYSAYQSLLSICLRNRVMTILLLVGLFACSIIGFGQVRQAFFPASNTPIFFVDYWRFQGSDIRETEKDIKSIQAYIQSLNGVGQVTASVGSGFPRFILTYNPENSYAAYGQLIVRMDSREEIDPTLENLRHYLPNQYLQGTFKFSRMEMGTGGGAKIEARFSGPDADVLRNLAGQAIDIIEQEPRATNVRHDWRDKTKVIKPKFNEAAARKLGITKKQVDDALLYNFTGKQVGIYREGTKTLPIIARPPKEERMDVGNLSEIILRSPVTGEYIPLSQVVNGFDIVWEDSLIMRRDRKRTITVFADPNVLSTDTATSVHNLFKEKIEDISLPKGYTLEWGGEYESSGKAQAALTTGLPLAYLAMFIITVLLFNNFRTPILIWLTVPLALIGVVAGLLLADAAFSFMALLGLLSLSGMLLKNGIVLVDQINLEMSGGKQPLQAVIDASLSRVRPVSMAALTTILGMIPLLPDVFFQAMAVAIMFGLGFATLLTLIVVPVFYTVFYRIDVESNI